MGQLITIITVIVVLVYIVGNLFSTKDEEEKQGPQSGSRRPPASRPRSPANDVERFLEEINRRKRAAPASPARPVAQSGPAAPRPRRPKTVRPPLSSSTPRNASAAVVARPVEARRPAAELVVAEVVRSPLAEQRPGPVEDLGDTVVVLEDDRFTPPAAPAAPTATSRPLSPSMTSLLPLLAGRQQLRSALVLHEILGPPRCHRPLRPGSLLIAQGLNWIQP
jgi:hypothetical protein